MIFEIASYLYSKKETLDLARFSIRSSQKQFSVTKKIVMTTVFHPCSVGFALLISFFLYGLPLPSAAQTESNPSNRLSYILSMGHQF